MGFLRLHTKTYVLCLASLCDTFRREEVQLSPSDRCVPPEIFNSGIGFSMSPSFKLYMEMGLRKTPVAEF